VRWRCVDLRRVLGQRFGADLSEVSLGRVLKKLGFSHISAPAPAPGSANPICPLVCRRVRLERLFPLCRPKRPRLFVLIAFELVSDPEQRTENDSAIVAGKIDDPGFDDEAA
jgi:hypothetical protein